VVTLGYHASHEQFPPGELLRTVELAEEAGFTAAMCSDHFLPWNHDQANSGFAWSWLGAAMATTRLPFGVVNAPGQRYHPAIVAQAAATLAEMFPGRFWVALGSGQNLNEHITGDRWPPKAERNARLLECVEVMRSLWGGETVTHHGLVTVDEAMLHSLPPSPPRVLGAAITPETAGWVAGWADGLITIDQPLDELRSVVEAFRDGGGAGKPMALQVQLSYAPTDDEALAAAHQQWGTNILSSAVLADLRTPAHFEAAAKFVGPDDLRGQVRISSDLRRHVDWLCERAEMGFDELYLHDVHRDQERFIAEFGEHVLPEVVR
jgi:coenzyme F420-dependent glucose-6-phosphate dehydrogenase